MAAASERGRRKRDLVAQAIVVANVYEKSALDIRAVVKEMLGHQMTELDMVEQVTTLALATPHEAPLTSLHAKLVAFLMAHR